MHLRFPTPSRARPARGVSLIEALVALAVMSFGMLALVGVQATLRVNGDVARQTTEGSRLATQAVEALRCVPSLTAGAATQCPVASHAEITSAEGIALQENRAANAVYQVDRSVTLLNTVPAAQQTAASASQAKVVQITSRWSDRTGVERSVTLDAVAARSDPRLSGLLGLALSPAAPAQRRGVAPSAPVDVVDLGNGNSGYVPPGVGAGGGVVWVFNNASGKVVSRCTSLAGAVVSGCTDLNRPGWVVSGTVRFDDRDAQLSAADAEAPQGMSPAPAFSATTPLRFSTADDGAAVNLAEAPSCYMGAAYAHNSALPSARDYACLVIPSDDSGWGGKLELVPEGWSLGAEAGAYRVCRYTTADGPYTDNWDHPRTYCQVSDSECSKRVLGNLPLQNFLVVRGAYNCPADTAVDVAAGNYVNSNTLTHQP